MFNDFKTANYPNALMSPELYARHVSKLLTGDVINGLTVTPGTGLQVVLAPGNTLIRYGSVNVASARLVSLVANFNLTVTTADVSNPRIDVVVVYTDTSVTLAANTADGQAASKAILVAGTPNASPVAPNDAAIQSAMGGSYPYTIVAQVRVEAGVSTIASDKITDVRTLATIGTAVLADGSVTNAKLSTTAGQPGGAWQSWTPTFTNWAIGTGGNAGTEAKYLQIGKTVYYRIRSTLGTSGISIGAGAITFSLPVAAHAELYNAITEGYVIGQAKLFDASVGAYQGRVQVATSTTAFLIAQNSSGTYVTQATANNATPFGWSFGDMWMAWGEYEAA